jgi:hypothetical protein
MGENPPRPQSVYAAQKKIRERNLCGSREKAGNEGRGNMEQPAFHSLRVGKAGGGLLQGFWIRRIGQQFNF